LRGSDVESIRSNFGRFRVNNNRGDYNIITNESLATRGMKQSHSVSYLRPKENEKSSLINSETPSPVKVQVKVKQTEDQSGND